MSFASAKELGHDSFQKTCPPGASYWADGSNTYCVIGSRPALPTARNTVAHIQAYDVSHGNTPIATSSRMREEAGRARSQVNYPG
ncbi:MAG TPA: hypothetical protein VHY37_06605 [Tepidisphaeraceae bacterium]|nr:hypothetical protein [Tepidisphaeraceae bacterium]